MKPQDDPWLKSACKNAEFLDHEIKKLLKLIDPIRQNQRIITKYQDFWNQAKHIPVLFRDLKPLAQRDRDLLWKQVDVLCREVRAKHKGEYGLLKSLSQEHYDETMLLAELAQLPHGDPVLEIHELVERGRALKNISDLPGKFKHEMIAKHKKTCFDRIQEIRKTHDVAWGLVKAEKLRKQLEHEPRLRKNLKANYERHQKAANALENFQIGRGYIITYLASCEDPEKVAKAKAQLAETEARIKDIEEGIRKLEKWIAEDERMLQGINGSFS
jgi:hypothetical protein